MCWTVCQRLNSSAQPGGAAHHTQSSAPRYPANRGHGGERALQATPLTLTVIATLRELEISIVTANSLQDEACEGHPNVGAGNVYWITGLSGAGKSTLARLLTRWLREQGRLVLVLDGDDLRMALGAAAMVAPHERVALASCYGRLCRLLALQGADVVIATMSLFHAIHRWNREHLPGYVEILLDVPMSELVARDAKGLYGGAIAGAYVAGVGQAVEFPENPHIVIHHTVGKSVEQTFAELLDGLRRLPAPA